MFFLAYSKFWILFLSTLLAMVPVQALSFQPFSQSFPLEIDKDGGKVICSAVAIAPTIILTAAHCVQSAQNIELVAGFDLDPGHVRYMALSWQAHPQYNRDKSNYHYDVARIILAKPLPSDLPYTTVGWPIQDEPIVRVGFGGRDNFNRRTLISGQELTYLGDDYFELNDEYGVMGDSGGPVFQWQNGVYILVGIHSTKEGNNKTYAVHPFFRF